jgi:seryl-tRNA synthetase
MKELITMSDYQKMLEECKRLRKECKEQKDKSDELQNSLIKFLVSIQELERKIIEMLNLK